MVLRPRGRGRVGHRRLLHPKRPRPHRRGRSSFWPPSASAMYESCLWGLMRSTLAIAAGIVTGAFLCANDMSRGSGAVRRRQPSKRSSMPSTRTMPDRRARTARRRLRPRHRGRRCTRRRPDARSSSVSRSSTTSERFMRRSSTSSTRNTPQPRRVARHRHPSRARRRSARAARTVLSRSRRGRARTP